VKILLIIENIIIQGKKLEKFDNINDIYRKKNFNFDYFNKNNLINISNMKEIFILRIKMRIENSIYQGKDDSYSYNKDKKENIVYI